jgi:hypothetical protein
MAALYFGFGLSVNMMKKTEHWRNVILREIHAQKKPHRVMRLFGCNWQHFKRNYLQRLAMADNPEPDAKTLTRTLPRQPESP